MSQNVETALIAQGPTRPAHALTALASPGRQLVYGYHAALDAMGHMYGSGSQRWRLQLAQVDRLVETIATRMPRTPSSR